MFGARVSFFNFESQKNNDDVHIDGVVEGFRGCTDLDDSTGHVWTEYDLVVFLKHRSYVVCSDFYAKHRYRGLVMVLDMFIFLPVWCFGHLFGVLDAKVGRGAADVVAVLSRVLLEFFCTGACCFGGSYRRP